VWRPIGGRRGPARFRPSPMLLERQVGGRRRAGKPDRRAQTAARSRGRSRRQAAWTIPLPAAAVTPGVRASRVTAVRAGLAHSRLTRVWRVLPATTAERAGQRTERVPGAPTAVIRPSRAQQADARGHAARGPPTGDPTEFPNRQDSGSAYATAGPPLIGPALAPGHRAVSGCLRVIGPVPQRIWMRRFRSKDSTRRVGRRDAPRVRFGRWPGPRPTRARPARRASGPTSSAASRPTPQPHRHPGSGPRSVVRGLHGGRGPTPRAP